MMTERDEQSTGRIEACRRINRKAAQMCHAKQATLEEVAIAAVYSTFDLAEAFAGREMAAIEWLRTAIDVLETGVMQGVRRPDGQAG